MNIDREVARVIEADMQGKKQSYRIVRRRALASSIDNPPSCPVTPKARINDIFSESNHAKRFGAHYQQSLVIFRDDQTLVHVPAYREQRTNSNSSSSRPTVSFENFQDHSFLTHTFFISPRRMTR